MNKAYSTDSLDRVKKGLQSNVFKFIDDQINDVGIDEALQNCNGNVSNAIIYYAGQHYKGVPGYSRDAETNGGDSSDKEYCNRPAKRRRTWPTKYAPIRSTSTNEPSTTNNKPSSASSGNGGYQQLEGSRKRKSGECKLLKYYLLFDIL